jgi:Concanavalin A-like lectin/glucanases superfamily/Divergent InlB B-repeat domain
MLKYSYDANGNLSAHSLSNIAPPQIISPPVQQIVEAGHNATFSVVVADTNGTAYQWLFNGTNIPGATGDSVLLLNVVDANEGQYSVVVRNSVGTVTSAPAALVLRRNPAVNTSVPPRLLVYSGECGSVAVAPMKLSYNLGDTVTLTATAFTNSIFAGWAGDLSTTDNPATLAINGDKMVGGRFSSTFLRLAAYSGPGGSLTIQPMKLGYTSGDIVTLTPLASPPTVFLGWTGDLSGSDNPATLTMDKNKTVRARFATPISSPPGLIAFWRGEVDATDLAGGHHDGVFVPTGPRITASGKVGAAFNFDGTVYVRIPDDPALQPPRFTAEAWVFPTAPGPAQTVIAHGDSWNLQLIVDIHNNNVPQFWSHGGQGLPGASAIPANEWTHLAITFDGFAKRIYVNGVEVISQDLSSPLAYPATPTPLTVGSVWSTTASLATELFNGRIDEVALYDRALTADEILDIYNADFLGKTLPYILPFQLPPGLIRTAYPPQQLVTILGASGAKTFSMSEGPLPVGMNLSPTGLIGGTPQQTGSFSFALRATDASLAFAEQEFVLHVLP